MAKDLKARWAYFETKALYYLKSKLSSAFIQKKLNQPLLSDSGTYNHLRVP